MMLLLPVVLYVPARTFFREFFEDISSRWSIIL